MAQLDTNIVVAALPSIGRELGAPAAVAWVTAGYLLTVTVSTPIHAKLGDLLGRRFVFVLSLAVFGIGSLACASAPSMPALIAARALQGIGGGGLVVTAISALGEMFDRDELIRRQIWLTSVTAISALAGPPVGGLLAAGPGWRWIFLVNPPVCIVALVLAARGLPRRHQTGALAAFDTLGAILIAMVGGGIVALGSSHALATSPLWAPLIAVGVLAAIIAFVHTERRARSPLIPPSLFTVPTLARSITVTGLTGIALFGTFTFIPLAIQAGTGADGGRIGTLLLALTLGQHAVTTTFAVLARRHPQLTVWGRLGLVLGTVGLSLIAAVPVLPTHASPLPTVLAIIGMALAGAALGLSMQAYTLLAQTTAPHDSFGAAMGTLTFARQLGGSLGTAAFGWLLLTIPDRDRALTVVLAAAAIIIAAAIPYAPRRKTPASDDTRVQTQPAQQAKS
ncbi:MFS transporter [Tsukamurella soli]|uniref:MFS transporter n=1 Tax=Tsukamurella soli TaxID=644556 RepID=A0ABP8J528_9ACTN